MTIWEELSDENEFCDVTLVCENKQISDHKLVFCFDQAMQCSSQLWKLKRIFEEHEYEFGVAQIGTSSGIIF